MGLLRVLVGGGHPASSINSISLGEVPRTCPRCGYEKMELISSAGFRRAELHLRCRSFRSWWLPDKSEDDALMAMRTEPGTPMTPFTD